LLEQAINYTSATLGATYSVGHVQNKQSFVQWFCSCSWLWVQLQICWLRPVTMLDAKHVW